MAAPSSEQGDSFVLDMATSAVAMGKLEVAECKQETFPNGWAIDKRGLPLKMLNDFHALLPLGGDEKSSEQDKIYF